MTLERRPCYALKACPICADCMRSQISTPMAWLVPVAKQDERTGEWSCLERISDGSTKEDRHG